MDRQGRGTERGGTDQGESEEELLSLWASDPGRPDAPIFRTAPQPRPPFSHGPELEPAASTASPGTPEMVRRVCGQGWGGGPQILR